MADQQQEQVPSIVITDDEGNVYAIPHETLAEFHVPTASADDVAGAEEDEVSGYFFWGWQPQPARPRPAYNPSRQFNWGGSFHMPRHGVIAAGGGNVIAAGGGNIIAAGGGN